ncbi:MAG TPA: energy transducer TonB [Terriglobales bacterium]|nr:energy transducer TonB [Terriglobales bacterium]
MRPPIVTALRARFSGVIVLRTIVSRTIVLGVFVLGTIVFSPSFSLAQEPSDVTRKIVSKVVPDYPELARKMKMIGTVRVEVTVAPNGKAKFTQVVGGSPVLAKAAIDSIEKWKWAPAPQETKELIELNFHP